MPNWCYTRIRVEDEKKNLENFKSLVEKWTSHNFGKNDFGLNWLGNIVGNSKIGTIDTEDESFLACRGRLLEIEVHDGEMIIDTETAWGPMLKMWAILFEKYLPDAIFYYAAEEGGTGLYITDDPLMENKYVIYSDGEDEIEYDSEATEETVVNILKECLKVKKEISLNNLLTILSEGDFPISINKWDFIPMAESY